MEKIRLGIIGMGNMGYGHLQSIVDGQCPRIEVTAFSDTDPRLLERAGGICPSAQAFSDTTQMLDSGLIEACIVCTPHYDHTNTPWPASSAAST